MSGITIGRARANAITAGSGSGLVPLSVTLANARREGLNRGVSVLAQMTVDWEAMAKQGLGTAAGLVSGGGSDGLVTAKIKEFLEYLAGKVADRISKSPWMKRAMSVLNWGIGQVVDVVKGLLTSKQVIESLIPFWSTIAGALKGGIQAWDASKTLKSLDRLVEGAQHVGGGIPTAALDAFHNYASIETLKMAGKSAWTFAKTIASLIAQIFSAGASKVLDPIVEIAEIVVTYINMIYQAATFRIACNKCRDFVAEKKVATDFEEEFATILGSCPLLGAFFFGMANYIGHANLVAVLSDPGREPSSSSLCTAVSSMSGVQRVACKFLSTTSFSPTFRTAASSEQYGWLLKMMNGMADDGFRTVILTENASRMDIMRHHGRRALGVASKVGRNLFG